MAKIVKMERVDEELRDEGFKLGQRVWLPGFKQAGTVTGMTDITIEGQSFTFRTPGVYRYIEITLDDGMEVRKQRQRIDRHVPVQFTETVDLADLTSDESWTNSKEGNRRGV